MKLIVILLLAVSPLVANAENSKTPGVLTVEQSYTLAQKLCNGGLDSIRVLGAGLIVISGAAIAIFTSPEVAFEVLAPEEYDAVTDDVIRITLDEADYQLLKTDGMDARCVAEAYEKLDSLKY